MPFSIRNAPLSVGVRAAWQARQGRCDSWHLLLDKLSFQPADAAERNQSPKLNALVKIREAYDAARPALTESAHHQQQFLARLAVQHGERFRRVPLVNASRLLLHLGRSSVLENVGLYCDRTTGLPLIPGSAVKGVISTWACWEAHFDENDGSFRAFSERSVDRQSFPDPVMAQRILGDNDVGGSTSAGEICFLGAWPETPPLLGLDTVTPHHDTAGHDRDPSPNPFLCIEPGTLWQFVLLAVTRNGSEPDSLLLLKTAERWLAEALEQSGAGAKTASGYGRFVSEDLWNRQTKSRDDLKAIADANAAAAAREAKLKEFRKATIGDYTEATFRGAVLKLLHAPGQSDRLRAEIARIRSNPENAPWIPQITEALRGKDMRDHRKRLKEKDWFPSEWIPQ